MDPGAGPAAVMLEVDGRPVAVEDPSATLLEVLRDQLGLTGVKDGCSPQGQCGCCTVLVDGRPRVACVTPVRRVVGRAVTTVDGLASGVRDAWSDALLATGGSQCGFCTPGIVVRLQALVDEGVGAGERARVDRALAAHLCRCTGWQTIREAYGRVSGGDPGRSGSGGPCGSGGPGTGPGRVGPAERDLVAAGRRASLEGGSPQRVHADVVLGRDGFADDTAPREALVAVPDGTGGWVVAETLREARVRAGKRQGRRTSAPPMPPLEIPPAGAQPWAVVLRTSWVEPAYLETDATWCEPGGEPASLLANGGAFGAKRSDELGRVARTLADTHGRPVRVLLAREETVRRGPKRPPVAAGLRADGSGSVRVVRTPGIAAAIAAVAPGLEVDEVDLDGPATSVDLRGAGWVEAAVLLAAQGGRRGEPVAVRSPAGGWAEARVVPAGADVALALRVAAGDPLDEVVLRSYCIGAAHMAVGWVTSEGLAVDADGEIHDLTVRSFGVLPAAAMPPVEVTVEPAGTQGVVEPTNGSDAVFAAVAAAVWIHQGCPPDWPTGQALV